MDSALAPTLERVRQACSFLFVPATRPERLTKALASGADLVIADWEDAVAPPDKNGARAALLRAVEALPESERARVLVRVNAEGTPWFEDDLAALAQLTARGCAGCVVPKAERADTLAAVARAAGSAAALVPLVESVAGLHALDALDALAAAPQVARIAFGHLDFQVDAGMECAADEAELLPVRLAFVLASRRAGLAAPVDGVTVDVQGADRLAQDAERARRLGFGGKLCIHPDQVAPLHAAFDPTPEAVAQAQRVLQALQAAGGGVVQLDGRMVDAPVLRQAERTLARHARARSRVAQVAAPLQAR
ncbi:CoA ester lyase [Melaminivora suipulveris]|uniref:CoA ester lyase n=1 Tax=Melaminivora suipulveris TaxID=2109913 RepID=A0A2R3QBX4_9BURK|nr:CoA ester lyase [Melaminivora suipulveris]AVO49286.1 CoA ester lyase [Melaminivora suipulveris]